MKKEISEFRSKMLSRSKISQFYPNGERFIDNVEKLFIQKWDLKKSADEKNQEIKNQKEILAFNNFEFSFTHFKLSKEEKPETEIEEEEGELSPTLKYLNKSDLDFNPKSVHPIHYFHGLKEFIVVCSNVRGEEIDNESRINQLLSTLSIALHNTDTSVPIFVQSLARNKNIFNGVYVDSKYRTHFQAMLLNKWPATCNFLSGFLYMFKTKITGDPKEASIESDIRVSARLSYVLQDWTCHAWTQSPPDLEIYQNLIYELKTLPFGAIKDPIHHLQLNVSWIDLLEDIITDNEVHSDLDPLEAPHWSIRIYPEEQPELLLCKFYLFILISLVYPNNNLF